MAGRQNEIDSALAEQLDAMDGSSMVDSSIPGRRSIGGAQTLMTFGAAPSHPPVEDDDYHEPELSQPTQFPFFPTPADEKRGDSDDEASSEQAADTSATLVVARHDDVGPPPSKRQKVVEREEEIPSTTPIDLDPPTPIVATKAKSRDILSLDDDIIRSPSQSESEDLPPVTQANPIRKSAESDDERDVVSDLGGDFGDSDDAMVIEPTPKPSHATSEDARPAGKKSSQTSKRSTGTQDEEDDAHRVEPEISDSEDDPPTTQAPPQKTTEKPTSSKPVEADEPGLSKFLNRHKVKGHKLEPPPKPAKKEAPPPPSPRKKAEPKKSESKKAAAKAEAPKEKRKKKDPFAMEVVEDEDEDAFIETRPKKTRIAGSPSKEKKSSKAQSSSSRSGKRNAKKRKRESSAEEDSFVEDDEEENNVASFPADDGDDEEGEEDSEEDMEELEKLVAPSKPRPKAPPKPRVAPKLTLFSGMTFVVTGIKEDAEVKADELKNVIKSFGGQIKNERSATARTKSSTAAEQRPVPSCVLISDVPQRTYKWIMALATCVPMLHYRWVQDCVSEGRIVDPLTDKKKYLLPAGMNYDGKMVPFPEWFLEENPEMELWETGVFWDREEKDQYRIDVVGVKEFRDQWRKVVIAAGAKAPDPDRLAEPRARTDFVLSDSQPSQLNATNAEKKKLPLCGHEWVIQSLIANECLDPDAQPSLPIKVNATAPADSAEAEHTKNCKAVNNFSV
eukprot:TRINITY_DN13459_c0_g1_i1.p1 TRINITY_DN13459_c0_g1~~TRINITY_DN13459_c0_g1_i1.p1  ORF type:complete len:731 (+),score=182.04 TRINITY_DN13459_c0_g1_i1:232-2424(+)